MKTTLLAIVLAIFMIGSALLYSRGAVWQQTPYGESFLPWANDDILEKPVIRLDDESSPTQYETGWLLSPKEGELFIRGARNVIRLEKSVEGGAHISLYPSYSAEDPLGAIAVNQQENNYIWDAKTICKETGRLNSVFPECFEIPTGFYKIKIYGRNFFVGSRRFAIVSEEGLPPSIELEKGDEEVTVHSGSEYRFTWSIRNLPRDFENWRVRILTNKDGAGETEILSLPLTRRTDTFFWQVPFFTPPGYGSGTLSFKGCLSRISSRQEYCTQQKLFRIVLPEKRDFSFGTTIMRVSPNGGDTVIQGHKINIRWSGGSCENCVQIQLRSSDSVQYRSLSRMVGWIAWSQRRNGEFLWDGKTVCSYPDPKSTNYKCSTIPPGYYAIEVGDSNGGLYGHPFTILAEPPH